jgi:citrate lyase beta subunit
MTNYRFIKYDDKTSIDHVLAHAGGSSVLCFDLEDSIQDWQVPDNTAQLKAHYRKNLVALLHELSSVGFPEPVGIRINAMDSEEWKADVDAMKSLGCIGPIFLPKVSGVEQILELRSCLHHKKVLYSEVIPVIETKVGMNQLERMVSYKDGKIRHLAFGHCDYNLDNAIYPFFHQDSREYWSWVVKILDIIRPYRVSFINSPFLQLHQESVFREILNVLYSLGGHSVGQIVLNGVQAAICNSFPVPAVPFISYQITHTHNFKVPDSLAGEFIQAFEQQNQGRGFTITEEGRLLSPQEYRASIKHLGSINRPDINFTFVGGCFPVQGNILFEDLFHQRLKRKMERWKAINFPIHIIRYERLTNCLAKIVAHQQRQPIDFLVFSVRPEPFLRLVKWIYRYFDPEGQKKKWSFSFPGRAYHQPEKADLLEMNNGFPSKGMLPGNRFRRWIRDVNYLMGSVLGNHQFAYRQYGKLLQEVIRFCQHQDIELIVLGPPVKSRSWVENNLTMQLERQIIKEISRQHVHYVSGVVGQTNEHTWFDRNGIYAREDYHALIADQLQRIMINRLDAPGTKFQKVKNWRKAPMYNEEAV